MKKLHDNSGPEAGDASVLITVKNPFIWSAALCILTLGAAYYVANNQAVAPVDIEYQAEPIQRPKRASAAEAESAMRGITNRAFEVRSRYCSRYARQVAEDAHRGTRFSFLYGASATVTAQNFLRYGYAVRWPSQSDALGAFRPGDVLFKVKAASGAPIAGGYGHVGVYTGNGLVAENSSTSIGRKQGAKGYRNLPQYGFIDVVGRLPSPARLYLDAPGRKAKLIPSGEFWEAPSPRGLPNQFSVQLREVSRALGRNSNDARRLPLRDALKAIGYGVTKIEYSKYRVTVSISK